MFETKSIKVKCDTDIIKGLFMSTVLHVELMLKYEKINIDKCYHKRKNTLLHYAAQNSAKKNIKFLLDKGADPNVFNKKGHTPLSLGLKHKFSNEIAVKLLIFSGANILTASKHFEDTFFGIRKLRNLQDLYVADRLVAQLAIHEALGHPVEKLVKALHDFNVPSLLGLYSRCREAIRRLKAQEIRDTCDGKIFTMFTILAARPEKVARIIRDEDWPTIQHYVSTYNKKTLTFYYREMLKKYTEDILKFSHCREEAAEIVREITGFGDVHYFIVNQIVDCFNARDLLMFK